MVNAGTELRKLRPAELYNLGLILDPSDNWKRLMASVTKEGSDDVPKFPSEYISIVEQAARQERKLAAAIFLEEWATMGKKRPTVGLLLDLLMKNELFRAADYVAQDIMKVEAPRRPSSGPAAAVDVEAIADLLLRQNLESGSNNTDFRRRSTDEMRLSQVDYSMGVFEGDDSTNDDNLHYDVGDVGVIEMQYAESRSNQVFEAARIAKNEFSHLQRDDVSQEPAKLFSGAIKSDLIKFSKDDNNDSKTQSDLLKFDSGENPNEKVAYYEAVMPNLSILCGNSSSKNDSDGNTNSAANASPGAAVNVEMTSAELPACLGGFGAADESSVIAEPDNSYFNRELMSAELPLCINDRLATSTSKYSSVESSECFDSEDDESEVTDSATEIPSVVVEAARRGRNEEKKRQLVADPGKNVLASGELPITVLEFHKR